jgi:hypothetical protein
MKARDSEGGGRKTRREKETDQVVNGVQKKNVVYSENNLKHIHGVDKMQRFYNYNRFFIRCAL